MFKLVETVEERQIFQHIYQAICRSENFQIESSSEKAVQYLLYHENEPVGTVEFAPYEPHLFTTVKEYDFMQIEEIRNNSGNVWEIDKLGLLKDYRQKNLLGNLMHILYHYYKLNPVDYAVCLFEYRFFRLMKRFSPSGIVSVGEPFVIQGEQLKVIPTVVYTTKWAASYEEKILSRKQIKV